MKNKDRLQVGMKCYLKAQGNEQSEHRGRPNEDWIYECEVIKVGRKYFEVKHSYSTIKYDINTLEENTNCCSDWKFYFDKQEALDEMEIKDLSFKFKTLFNRYDSEKLLALDQLRRINAIIEE